MLDRIIAPFESILPEKLYRALVTISRDTRTLLAVPVRCGGLAALSIFSHAWTVLIAFVLSLGMGVEVGLLEMMVLVPPVVLMSMLPISLAGWGVREGAMVAALGLVGVAPADALALSVVFGLILLIGALPGAAIWFVTGRRIE